MPPQFSSGTRSIIFGLVLHLLSYFMYVSSEGSGKTEHLPESSMLIHAIITKISPAGSNNTWVEDFQMIPEFRILRLTFYGMSASKFDL